MEQWTEEEQAGIQIDIEIEIESVGREKEKKMRTIIPERWESPLDLFLLERKKWDEDEAWEGWWGFWWENGKRCGVKSSWSAW